MAETKNEQHTPSLKRKLGNTAYTIKVHFNKDTNKTFKDRVQKLIIKECLEKIRNNPLHHLVNLIRGQLIIGYKKRKIFNKKLIDI